MRLPLLLQKVFAKASTHIDKRLHRLLLECAETLCDCRHLSIAGLGRALKRKAYVKHNIKTVDRLFGNETVLKNRHDYYRVCANWLVGNNPHPIVLVDWSGLSHCGKYHFLCASVPVGGRALPVLEMAFEEKEYGSQKAHALFLTTLASILPKQCQPIVITDAGFRHCRAQNVKRFEVALLIAALAMFLLWLIGRVKKEDNSHFSYQANTVRSRNVLSCFSIGWQVLKRGELQLLSWRQLLLALESFAFLEGGI